jgi:hypothetical protein
MSTERPDFALAATALAEDTDSDILFYNSLIQWDNRNSLVDLCSGRQRRTNVLLILITGGGDPDAAYRMARCLQNQYAEFKILLPGYCKSAGTLVALGANEIIMSDSGEIGPLDMQMYKADEFFERSSGLTVMEALDTLKQKSFSMFQDTMLSLKRDSGNLITFRTASEVAAELTAGLFSRIYEQIEPIKVGEIGRALKVAQEYGTRLDSKYSNLKEGALETLLASYPSHSFVIDFYEAANLFHRIRKPNDLEAKLISTINIGVTRGPAANPIIQFISDEITRPQETNDERENREDSQGQGTGTEETSGSAGTEAAAR